MKLSHKLFASYLLVIAVSLTVLSVATSFIAPQNFWQTMHNRGGGGPNRGGMMERMELLDEQLDSSVRASVNNALLLAGGAAVITAILASWFVSQRIVRPIRAVVDVSQRIASGHYDERLNARTGDELGELMESFDRMASALDESETTRRQLLADVTHELKTPLASIKGYMEGLQDNILPAGPETFQLVHREAARLQRLVEDLQELSRVEAGQVTILAKPLDAALVVQSVVERMQPQFVEKEIALQTEVPPGLPRVRADHDRMEQILTNLLGNALQYTARGGAVKVCVKPSDHMLDFAVRDTGIGLAPEDRERVFQRFYRVDKSRSRASGGSGIGLTITRYLVEAQGGKIWAESAGLGQGSTFHFTLPAA